MRHRIYIPEPLIVGAEVAVEGDELHHAVRVVRVREGEEVELFDGRGRCVAGKVTESGRALRVAIEREVPSREPSARLHLAMAIIQLDRFELEDGSVVEVKGNEEIEYDGETHTAANLFDALKEGYYGKF